MSRLEDLQNAIDIMLDNHNKMMTETPIPDIAVKNYTDYREFIENHFRESEKIAYENARLKIRVEELKRENSKLKQQVDFWRVEDGEMMRLSEENQRYKQALQEISEVDEDTWSTDAQEAKAIARKALEGEE